MNAIRVANDNISAYAWFQLALEQKYGTDKDLKIVATRMSDAEVSQAKALADRYRRAYQSN